MTQIPSFSSFPQSGREPKSLKDCADVSWVRRIVDGANTMLGGKMNAVLPIVLRANFATTDLIDARIGPYSAFLYEPTTTNAFAAFVTSPYVIATNKNNGSATLNHANDANTDKTFNLVIIG